MHRHRLSHALLEPAVLVNPARIRERVGEGAELEVVDDKGATPLFLACAYGQPESLACLLELGAHAGVRNNDGYSPWFTPIKEGYLECVKVLAAHGQGLDEPTCAAGFKPLHLALNYAQIAIVDSLIEAGADLSAKDKSGDTPLHYACQVNHMVEPLKQLLTCGADPGACNAEQETPLHRLFQRGPGAGMDADFHKARALCAAGADVNASNVRARTPLHEAAYYANAAAARFLLELGAAVEGVTPGEPTPLALACQSRSLDVIALLCEAGANPDADCATLGTPRAIAERVGGGVLALIKARCRQDKLEAEVGASNTPAQGPAL